MNQTPQTQICVILLVPVREGSTRPPAGWCEGETSPLKILFIYLSFILQASAKLAAEQAGRMVKGSIRASMERIDSENENMRTWEENMVRRSGYHVDGKNIHRDAVVDSTIGKTYYETQNVHYYEDFYNAGPTISVSLSKTMLEGLNSSAIMLLVEQANYDIENWSTDIFVKVEKDDEGKCQMGQIMLDFQWNCMIEQQGWQKVALPAYDQPFWRGVSARRKCRQITIRKQRCYA